MNTEENVMWKVSKALRTNKNQLPPIHGQRGMAYMLSEKAEVFADSLELQCAPNFDEELDLDHVELIHNTINNLINQEYEEEEIDFLEPQELHELLKHKNVRKASGPDQITNLVLRHLPKKPTVALCNIINSCMRLGHFPQSWKITHIVVIHKPGKDAKFPQNHRPISLLSNLAKIAERCILKRIQAHCHTNNIIQQQQHGFREGHSS